MKKSAKRYLIPIRYWEDDAEPIEVRLIENQEGGFQDNYVYHSGYGHNAYVEPKDLFKTKAQVNNEIKKRLVVREQQAVQEIERLMENLEKQGML